jgi:hypothetical protein
MDVDLGVAISPLGVLHTLGVQPKAAVAASGRSSKPSSVGSLVMPYDISAFRPDPAHFPQPALLALHEKFCEITRRGGAGFNRATCDFASAFHVGALLAHDKLHPDAPYAVASAFNGAILYPIEQLRLAGARYDTSEGSVGLCEWIPFHDRLKQATPPDSGFSPQLLTNPKWAFLTSPYRPPGPTGPKFLKFVRANGGEASFQILVPALVGLLLQMAFGLLVLRLTFYMAGAGLYVPDHRALDSKKPKGKAL